jgi:hypothetical protein
VPDSDLSKAIRSGKAEVVTDTIDHFTEDGVALASGRHLAADLVVTATGLELQFLGGMTVAVDGHAIDPATTWNYKGAMLSGVPNLAVALGYTNASWTLKAELACQFACRVLNHLAASGHKVATPVQADPTLGAEPLLDLSSGYVTRALPLMPRQGARPPWRLYQSYPRDLVSLRHGALDDGVPPSSLRATVGSPTHWPPSDANEPHAPLGSFCQMCHSAWSGPRTNTSSRPSSFCSAAHADAQWPPSDFHSDHAPFLAFCHMCHSAPSGPRANTSRRLSSLTPTVTRGQPSGGAPPAGAPPMPPPPMPPPMPPPIAPLIACPIVPAMPPPIPPPMPPMLEPPPPIAPM